MIEQIKIKNFQCHRDLTLQLSEGVNIITGSSDNGKSAVIRALNWVIFNRPTGFSFQTEGVKKDTSVEVKTSKGVVKRVRGTKENCYVVGSDKFKALKGEVPAEVRHILNIPEESVQNQFDPHFMFNMSPGETAKMFNDKAPGLQDIDPLFASAKRYVSELEGLIVSKGQTLEDLRSKIGELTWTKEFSVKLKSINKDYAEVSEIEEDIHDLSLLLEQYISVQERLENYKWVDKAQKSFLSLEESFGLLTDREERMNQLKQTSSKIRACQNKLKGTKKILAIQDKIDSLEKVNSALKEKQEEANILIVILENRENLLASIEEKTLLIKELQTQIDKVQSEEETKICPTCKRPL